MPVRMLALARVMMAAGLAVALGAAAVEPRASTLSAPVLVADAAVDATAAATADQDVVTVRPDPAYRDQPFEGWGTSLAWFANITGDYPAEIRERLADLVFGADGLNLNIARYNIGGGNAPDVKDYLRPGGAVEGWWAAPPGTTRADKDWWNPDDPTHWNLDADATQRWWVDRIKGGITRWEAFSNTPPYFQTVSGYVSGGFDSGVDQIRPETIDGFATYLARVTKELESAHGIEVATLDPLNEPNTTYWGTRLGPDGTPTGGRQEGAHAGPASQQNVIRAVATELAAQGMDTKVSAMDETNPGKFLTNWNAYSEQTRAQVSQLNVHTYGTGQRTAVRDLAKAEGKPLWMGEVEGNWGTGQSFTDMAPGLGMAQHMVDDLRELEPSAWAFWQPVEDYANMAPGGETAAGLNWGSIQIRFDCGPSDTLTTCPIYTNTKFDTIRNLTHYIRPGDQLLKTGDTSSVAAISPKNEVTVVYVNDGTAARTVNLDLSGFSWLAPGATVTPVVTSSAGALVSGAPVRVTDRAAAVKVPARSVTTLVVQGEVGPADSDAVLIRPGHVYRLQGEQSGRSLTPAAAGTAGLTIRSSDPDATDQLWTMQPIGSPDNSNRTRYRVATAVGDHLLSVVDGNLVVLPDDSTTTSPAAQWILSTTGNGRYTLVNVGSRRLIDVDGQATADGSSVGVWTSNAAVNQQWQIIDETVLGVQPVEVFTTPGVEPVLPPTVVPVHPDGARGAMPVTWTLPTGRDWRPGAVKISGVATDPLGRTYAVTATVYVDILVSTTAGRSKTYVGGAPSLPPSVEAVTSRGYRVQRPVVWDPVAPTDYARVGVVAVTGRADAGAGSTIVASARLQVTEPNLENGALEAGTSATATFTEPGYSATAAIDGMLTGKAWSNWKSEGKNASDTLTVNLPRPRDVTEVITHFYRDGANDTYAQTLRVEARADSGDWFAVSGPVAVPAGAPAPVVPVAVPASAGPVRAVRVVMDAYPNRHILLSEVRVLTKVAGRSADSVAASIALDGRPVSGFAPGTTEYTVRTQGAVPVVTAVASDPYATVKVARQTSTRSATVQITSEDGTSTTRYAVHFR